MSDPRRLRLLDYYLIEAVSSMAATLFLYCLYFWTQHRFHFSNVENLLLSSTHGIMYVLGARYGGRLADRLGPDRLLAAGLAGMTLLLAVGWLPEARITPFVLVPLYTICLAPTWPALESGILHTPSAWSTPRRLGMYNIIWAFCSAVGFFAGGTLFAWRPDAIVWGAAILHGVELLWLWGNARRHSVSGHAAMAIPHRGDQVPRNVKRRFVGLAWLANALGYFMLHGFSALLPFITQRLGLTPALGIWVASSLLFSRGFAFVLFWRWEAWHYRARASLLALWGTPLLLAVIFISRDLAVVMAALLLMGITLGLSYFTSIYYTLDYGEKKGEGGGLHEAILGAGMSAGPLVGALGACLFGGAAGAQMTLWSLAMLGTLFGTLAFLRGARRDSAVH